MILFNNVQSLQVVLAGAVATAQPTFYAGYVDLAANALATPPPVTGATNGVTAVTVVAAPAPSTVRQLKYASIYNADSAAVTVTVRINDNGTNRTLLVSSLLPGDRLEYVDSQGWRSSAGVSTPVTPDFITGLKLGYTSGTAYSVSSGAAYVQSLARRLDSPSTLSKSSLSLSASTFYHVYLFLNGSLPDVEAVTTAPTAAYFGGARSKTGDTSRRYLGSFKTDAGGNIIAFTIDTAGEFRYLISNATAPLRALSNGQATVRTTVSLGNAMPATATHAILICTNTDTTTYLNITMTGAAAASVVGIGPNSSQVITFPCSTGQQIDYFFGAAVTGGAYIDVVGFTAER